MSEQFSVPVLRGSDIGRGSGGAVLVLMLDDPSDPSESKSLLLLLPLESPGVDAPGVEDVEVDAAGNGDPAPRPLRREAVEASPVDRSRGLGRCCC